MPKNVIYSVLASQSTEGKKRAQEYYEALGRFVDMFAVVETAMQLALRHYAGTTDAVAKAVFSGVRMDTGMGHIRRLRPNLEKIDPELHKFFGHLKNITTVRNTILHYGTKGIASGTGIATDALTKSSPQVFPVSISVLEAMTNDRQKIAVHLLLKHVGGRKLRRSRPWIEQIVLSPLRYKHPQQQREGKERATPRRSQGHGQ